MTTHIPVIIVGGGPVGLTMAIALAEQGIASTVIEKHPSTTNHPKARGVNGRSMEIFRLWGLEQTMHQHQLPKEARRFIWLEDFQKEEITRIESNIDYSKYSPTCPAIISQDCVEKELVTKAANTSLISLCFNHLMIAIKQDDKQVTVQVKNKASDEISSFTGEYLVAADGANSSLREKLNVQMQGQDNLGEFCNIYCEMDLDKYIEHRPSVGYMFTREDILGTFLLAKAGLKKWLVGIRLNPDTRDAKEMFSDDYCLKLINNIIRDDTVNVRLINKSFWTMAALLADKYRVGRVFLAGDAAHRLPPTGGFGMNTGIQDSHNLAWKLAMVLKGHANDSLLDSYFTERAPIAQTNLAWSSKNNQRFTKIYTALFENNIPEFKQALEEQHQHLNNIQLDLGFIYGHDYLAQEEYQPSHQVGARAPHILLTNGAQTISSLDLFKNKFILLCDVDAIHWQQYVNQFSHSLMECITIGTKGNYQDDQAHFLSSYGIGRQGAVLVRPDGHIAWRAEDENSPVFDYEQLGLIVRES